MFLFCYVNGVGDNIFADVHVPLQPLRQPLKQEPVHVPVHPVHDC